MPLPTMLKVLFIRSMVPPMSTMSTAAAHSALVLHMSEVTTYQPSTATLEQAVMVVEVVATGLVDSTNKVAEMA